MSQGREACARRGGLEGWQEPETASPVAMGSMCVISEERCWNRLLVMA